MQRTVVLNVVGLTQELIGESTPNLSQLRKSLVHINATVPAVTCTSQSTYLTGKFPCDHGIVANGWYFRELGQVWLWRQSNALVQGPKLWHMAKDRNPLFRCANTFWWYNMHTDADYSLTPRPLYCADGRKLPDCYGSPPGLRERFTSELGAFPLFQFWGPGAGIESSQWIANAAMKLELTYRPTMQLVYLPHLDYPLQKLGPDGDLGSELQAIDQLCGRLIAFFTGRGCRVVILSEYGITKVNYVVHPNRMLRDAGLLHVKVDLGREYLDLSESRAFAVSDHQIAHVYVKNSADVASVKKLFEGIRGVEKVLDNDGKRQFRLDHERSGEIVLISTSNSWFTYYFWQHDSQAPDYARTVNIHEKPGYDPCEMLLDPKIRFPKLAIGTRLLKKALGFRYLMDLTPLDAALIKGSHARPTDKPEQGPVLMTTEPKLLSGEQMAATCVCDLLLDHVFC